MSTRYVWLKQKKTSNIYTTKTEENAIRFLTSSTGLSFFQNYAFDSTTGLYQPGSVVTYDISNLTAAGVDIERSVNSLGMYVATGTGTSPRSVIYRAKSSANYWKIGLNYNNIPQVFEFRLYSTPTDIYDLWKYSSTKTSSGSTTNMGYVSSNSSSSYPSNGAASDGYTYIYQGSDNIDPYSVSYSVSSPQIGVPFTITVSPRSPTYSGTVYYQYQHSFDGGSNWINLTKTTATSFTTTLTDSSVSQYRVRVLASDNLGFTSSTYITGSNLMIQSVGGDNYVGIGGTARQIDKIYIGIGGTAREVTEGYIGVGGTARKFYG